MKPSVFPAKILNGKFDVRGAKGIPFQLFLFGIPIGKADGILQEFCSKFRSDKQKIVVRIILSQPTYQFWISNKLIPILTLAILQDLTIDFLGSFDQYKKKADV